MSNMSGFLGLSRQDLGLSDPHTQPLSWLPSSSTVSSASLIIYVHVCALRPLSTLCLMGILVSFSSTLFILEHPLWRTAPLCPQVSLDLWFCYAPALSSLSFWCILYLRSVPPRAARGCLPGAISSRSSCSQGLLGFGLFKPSACHVFSSVKGLLSALGTRASWEQGLGFVHCFVLSIGELGTCYTCNTCFLITFLKLINIFAMPWACGIFPTRGWTDASWSGSTEC